MNQKLTLMVLALLALPVLSLAQVVADPAAPKGQRPTVVQAVNGVTQVNVQTPSAAGVSRNIFRRFDIDGRGVILNNSRTDTPTELGGWIQGNPWLARGAARVLLTEVNGGDPSQLAGRIEVAGSRAEVVVANPAGITCNGCGFINASRATLTTGTPVLSDGALQAFRVQGGTLVIEGKGLEARGTDYAALLARAIRVNAAVRADQLAVVAGAGEIPAREPLTASTPLQPLAAKEPTPRVQLDVAALGGLYAGKIFLVGTEAGLGMVHAGRTVADTELVLRSDGWLTQSGLLQAGQDLQLSVRGLDNRGGAVTAPVIGIETADESLVNQAGLIAASDRLRISAGAIDNSRGVIISDGDLQAASTGLIRIGSGLMAAGRSLQIEGAELLVEQGGSLASDGSLQLRVAGGFTNAGQVGAASALTVSAGDIDNAQQGALTGTQTLIQARGNLINRGLVDGAVTRLEARNLRNVGTGRLYGDVLAIGAYTLTNESETLAGTRTDAVIAARERLDIGARLLTNQDRALVFSAGTGGDALTIGGQLDAAGRATGRAERVINSSATIESLGGLRVDTRHLENQNAHFETHLVQTQGPTQRFYIQPEGRSRLPGELFVWEGWSRAGRYRYRTDPSVGAGAVLGQSPIPRVGEQSCTGEPDHEVCSRLPGADYLAGDPAWGYFGLRPPEPEPLAPTLRKPVVPDVARAGACESGTAHDPVACGRYQDDLAAYQKAQADYAQAWSDHGQRQQAWQSDTDTRYAQLDDRIESYNAGFAGSRVQNWTQYHVTRTEYETRVLKSDPGRILSGGDMHLAGDDLLNDKSQIVAGGALTGDLANLHTVEAQGVRIVNESGTSQYTASRWRGGAKRYHQRDWSSLATYAPADEVTPIVFPVAQRLSHTGASSAPGPGGAVPDRTPVLTVDPAAPGGMRVRTLAVTGAWPLPASGLFRPAADATAGYFIETDPRFTQRLLWQQQGPDVSQLGKRLGDTLFEQQLVRDQVLQLTGRRFLAGHTSDELQYRALMQAGETYAQAHALRPGVALSAAQMAQLTSDMVWLVLTPVTLPDGRTVQALVPRLYVVARPGDLEDSGALLAGDAVDLRLSGDMTHTGTIAGRTSLVIDAQSIHNLGGRMSGRSVALQARDDLENLGGRIDAQRSLSVHAGRDLTLASTATTQKASAGRSDGERTHIDRVAGLYVTDEGGVLLARAGRDLTLRGAQVMNRPSEGGSDSGPTLLIAGRDLRLESVAVSDSTRTVWDARNFQNEASRRDVGTQIQVQGDLAMSAGRDLNARAARITSNVGAVALQAGQDMTLSAGEDHAQRDGARHWVQRGTLSSRSVITRDTVDTTRAVATTVSGETVRIEAGRDMTVRGGQIVGTHDMALTAGRDASIAAATELGTEFHERSDARKGVFSSGGAGFTIGRREAESTREKTEVTLAPSTVGSAQGSVVIEAGQAYRQSASGVLAPEGNVSINARTIEVNAGLESVQSMDRARFRQSGMTVAVTNPVITAAQTADQMARAASDTQDPRMRALAAATTALTAHRALEAVKAQPDTAGGVAVSVSVGSNRSDSETRRTSESVVASRVVAGGDLYLRAQGAGQDSSLTVRGSDLQAGATASLKAEGDIDMRAAAQRSTEHGTQRSSGASVGVGVSLSGKGADRGLEVGMTASASASRGITESHETQWRNAQVQAAGKVVLEGGKDISLRGAVVQGEQVVVDAGARLAMESLQDVATYRSRDESRSGSVTAGASITGSLSLGKSHIDSSFTSTGEQTALRAGDSGFDVRVQGEAVLTGAAITSTDTALQTDRNRLEANRVITIDIENRAQYLGASAGASFGAGQDPQGKLAAQGTGGGYGRDGQSAQSVTRAGVSGLAGNLDARTGDTSTSLRPIFEPERVRREIQAQVTITAAAGIEAQRIITSHFNPRKAALRQKLKEKEMPEGAKEVARTELRRIEREERVMNILLGAVTGLGNAAAVRETLGEVSKQMRDLMIADSKKFVGVRESSSGNEAILSNLSGISHGVDDDGLKVAGARVSLDIVCGVDNRRCQRSVETNELVLDSDGYVRFTGEPGGPSTLKDFMKTEEGKKMAGLTGGVQGGRGTLFGVPYEPGGWVDSLMESFSGPHDLVGGKAVGTYGNDGGIRRGRAPISGRLEDFWSATGAIVISAPFAMATLLPPEIWTAVNILLKAAR